MTEVNAQAVSFALASDGSLALLRTLPLPGLPIASLGTDLLRQFGDRRLAKPVLPFFSEIALASFKLLEETHHSDGSQRLSERFQTDSPDFLLCHFFRHAHGVDTS